MDRNHLRGLLEELSTGQRTVDQALEQLSSLPVEDLDFAQLDSHRGLRLGFPEVVFGQGKTSPQIVTISQHLIDQGGPLLVTRISSEAGQMLSDRFPDGEYDSLANTFHLIKNPIPDQGRGEVLVVCAGTSDLPVAREAALTARLMGNRVDTLTDVGVAGIHRLLKHNDKLRSAQVLVVVAGMEGALPSVVGGLVDKPVVAVPTSIGYGASLGGLAALLAMLNSCAPGITVVNIDNGFGAGYAAALINRRSHTSGQAQKD